jgi:hypothetical protein
MLRAEFREHLFAHKRRYGGFLVVWFSGIAAVAALMLALDGSPFVAGLFVGILLGALLLFAHVLFVALGLGHRSMGADAEQWTAEELGKLDHRWTVFHDVPLSRSNIDHVVIGPGRVYAIETKWTARTDTERFLKGAAWQAAQQAKDLAAELRERGVGREVLPILVVWGPGTSERLGDKPRAVKNVAVVAGHHSNVWRERMTRVLDRLEADLPATQALRSLLAEHEAQLNAPYPPDDEITPLTLFVNPPPSTEVDHEPAQATT